MIKVNPFKLFPVTQTFLEQWFFEKSTAKKLVLWSFSFLHILEKLQKMKDATEMQNKAFFLYKCCSRSFGSESSICLDFWSSSGAIIAQNMEFPIKDFFSKCDQTSTEEILNRKFHFLCSEWTQTQHWANNGKSSLMNS